MEDEDMMDKEHALAALLQNGVCFISEADYLSPWELEDIGATTAVLVNCNDQFYWGSADVEPLPHREILTLYYTWEADPVWGVTKWCCLRRGLRPQVPIVERIKAAGAWTEELEALPAPAPS